MAEFIDSYRDRIVTGGVHKPFYPKNSVVKSKKCNFLCHGVDVILSQPREIILYML